MARQEFDSKAYWQERHQRYGESPLGVGNATYSEEKNAQIYDSARGYVSKLLKALDLPITGRVLDIGCGIGMLADCFINAGMLYTGVDISEDAVTIARRKHPFGAFAVGDISQMEFRDPFALIIERTVMIHVVEDELWKGTLAAVARNLADTGVFILLDSIPEKETALPKGISHVRFRSMAEYVAALKEVGLAFDQELRARVQSRTRISANTHFVTKVR